MTRQALVRTGGLGCGPSCGCAPRGRSPWRDAFRLFDRFAARVFPPARCGPFGLGDPPPQPGALRFPAFETIRGFARNGPTPLGPGPTKAIGRLADTILGGMQTANPFTAVRLVGYIAGDEGEPSLGLRRAQAVQSALLAALMARDPNITRRLRFLADDCGFSPDAPRVDVLLWVGPGGPPPVPCAARIPSPAEAARGAVRTGPETVEERIARILREPVQAPKAGRSFSQAFWSALDENVDRVMSRAGVPTRLRGPIREGVRKAVEKGAESILDRVLGETGLPGTVQDAIKSTVRATVQTPVR